MNFNKLLEIVKESTQISISEYSNKLKSAYRVVFDLDDSEITSIEQKDLSPPSYCHHYYKVNIDFSYNNKKYKVYHALYHYKISKKSVDDLNKTADAQEWEDFLKNVENFDAQPLTDYLLKNKNIQIMTRVGIYEITDETDKFGMNNRNDLGAENIHGSIGDVVTRVKTIIDKKDGDDNYEVFSDPVVPNSKLVPA